MSGYQIGDVVRLISGSPAMTVVGLRGDLVLTNWFHDGELRTGEFAPAVLKGN